MTLARRLARLESTTGGADGVTWEEIHAIEQRTLARARALIAAWFAADDAGEPFESLPMTLPELEQMEVDRQRRIAYYAARGVDIEAEDRANAPATRARLLAEFTRRAEARAVAGGIL